MKKKHIDFTIGENFRGPVVMRFYPKKSHCHSHNENPPKDWRSVYKVYYSWSILQYVEGGTCYPLFEMEWDENSSITCLAEVIEWVVRKKKKFYRELTFGQPAADWEFRYRKDWSHQLTKDGLDYERVRTPEKDILEISVFNNVTDQGYRFYLSVKDEVPEFIKYLREVNDHMLENGEAI